MDASLSRTASKTHGLEHVIVSPDDTLPHDILPDDTLPDDTLPDYGPVVRVNEAPPATPRNTPNDSSRVKTLRFIMLHAVLLLAITAAMKILEPANWFFQSNAIGIALGVLSYLLLFASIFAVEAERSSSVIIAIKLARIAVKCLQNAVGAHSILAKYKMMSLNLVVLVTAGDVAYLYLSRLMPTVPASISAASAVAVASIVSVVLWAHSPIDYVIFLVFFIATATFHAESSAFLANLEEGFPVAAAVFEIIFRINVPELITRAAMVFNIANWVYKKMND